MSTGQGQQDGTGLTPAMAAHEHVMDLVGAHSAALVVHADYPSHNTLKAAETAYAALSRAVMALANGAHP